MRPHRTRFVRVLASFFSLWGSACGSRHSTIDAGGNDARAVDAIVMTDVSAPNDAVTADSPVLTSDGGGPIRDAFDTTDAFTCRASNDVCTFGEDCCSGACILKPGGDGICV